MSTLPINIPSFHFSPDGQRILSHSILYLQNPYVKVLGKNYGRVTSMQFNPQGNRIVTYVRSEGAVRVWDKQGQLLTAFKVGELISHASGTAIKFNANGNQIYTRKINQDTEAEKFPTQAWNLQGQEVPMSEDNPWGDVMEEPKRYQYYVGRHDSPSITNPKVSDEQGDRIATFDEAGKITVSDSLGNQLAEYKGYGAAFSPDGQQIAIVSEEDNTPRIYQVEDLDGLLKRGCDWLKFEIVSTNNDSTKQMCNL